MKEENEIIEALKIIKKHSPKLHLYLAAKLLERTEKGTYKIKAIECRRTLGSIFHINKQSQLKILEELEAYRLILRVNRKEYIIPFTEEDYQDIFKEPVKRLESDS